MTRRIIVYIATSADGYIARPDGDVAWLNRPAPEGHYGYADFVASIDTILWGRKTWEVGLELGGPGALDAFGADTRHFVFSRAPRTAERPGVEWVREPVDAFLKRLRATPGRNVWMMGGGELIASFLDAGAIDEFIIHVIPVFIGEGIPLVAPRHRDLALALKDAHAYEDSVVRLHYLVGDGPLT